MRRIFLLTGIGLAVTLLAVILVVHSRPRVAPQAAATSATAPAAPVPTTMQALMPDTPGHHNLRVSAAVGEGRIELPLRLYIPAGYDRDKATWPLVIFLHDQGQRGNDLAAVAGVGIEKSLRSDDAFRNNFKLMAASPQCPAGASWDDPKMTAAVLAMIQQLRSAFRIDPDRIYITGMGAGATGACHIAMASPDELAAVAVSSVVSSMVNSMVNSASAFPGDQAARMRHLPVSVVAGASDKEGMAGMASLVEAIQNSGGAAQFAQVGNSRDECSAQFHAAAATYDWLLKQKRRTAQERTEHDRQLAQARKDWLAKLPTAPGQGRVEYSTWVGTTAVSVPCLVSLPKGYDKSADKWPAMVFMHDAGEADRTLGGNFASGPGFEMGRSEPLRDAYRFITLYPAMPDSTPERIRAAARLIADLTANLRVDADRVYCTGPGAGGTATWLMAQQTPQMFAAVAPISGVIPAPDDSLRRLAPPHTWIIAAANDGACADGGRRMAQALTAARGDVQLSLVNDVGHDLWKNYYADPRFYEALLQYRRGAPEVAGPTTVAAGAPPVAAPAPPREPGHYRMSFTTKVGDQTIDLPYGLYLPRGYDKSSAAVPAVLYLHDPAERGTGLTWIFNAGLDPTLANNGFPAIGICPQLPPGARWDQPQMIKALLALLDDAGHKSRLDPERVYVTGPREGGTAAWMLMLEAPPRFAAVASYQTAAIPVAPDKLQPKHKYLNAWIGAAGNDGGVSDTAKRVADVLKPFKATVQLSLAPAVPPPGPIVAYYTDPHFYEPLLKIHRLSTSERASRVAAEAREELVSVPITPGIYKRVFVTELDGKPFDLPYAISVPPMYAPNNDRFATVLFLHGGDARGSDYAGLFRDGPMAALNTSKLREQLRAIVIAPQCPAGRTWTQPALLKLLPALLDQLGGKLRFDVERTYVCGLDMGGTASWQLALDNATRFAAVVPVQAGAAPAGPVSLEHVEKLRYTAAWIAADYNDAVTAEAARLMGGALGDTANEVKLDLPWEFKTEPRWLPFFSEPALYTWLLAHHRMSDQERHARDERQAKDTAPGAIPTSPGHHKLKINTIIDGKEVEEPYLVYLPQGYDKSKDKWPTLVFLHGAGMDANDMAGMFLHGPAAHLQQDQRLRDWYPMINISPVHNNSAQGARAVLAALDDAMRKFRIDPDRVYLTGFSLGGTSVYWVAEEGGDRFAAAFAIAGRVVSPEQVAAHLKYTPTWITVGGNDGPFLDGSQKVYSAMCKAGDDVHLTIWPGRGHDTWPAYYSDRRFYEWFLPYRRMTPQQRAVRDKMPLPATMPMTPPTPSVPTTNHGALASTAPTKMPTPMPTADGSALRTFDVTLSGKPVKLTCGLYLPKGYTAGKKRWPMLIHLHNENDRGSELAAVFDWGSDADPRRDDAGRYNFPMIGVAPQCPTDHTWSDADMLAALGQVLDELSRDLQVDEDRIYLAGSGNMGQAGAWALAMAQPKRFAAVAPFCMDDVFKPEMAPRLHGAVVSLTTFERDAGALGRARHIVDLLKPQAASVALNLLSEDPAQPAWQPYYTEPKLCQWLLSQKRKK